MGSQNVSKLNRLTQILPEGVASPSKWLASHGFSRQLVRKYVQNGWLVPLARGVFARPTHPMDANGVILGMQRLAGAAVHLGGISALNRLGYSHYLPLGGEAYLHFWGQGAAPGWVRAVPRREQYVFHRQRLFDDRARGVGLSLRSIATGIRDWKVVISSHERAIMEVFSLVDDCEFSFTHASELFEGMGTMRPNVVNELLAACRSFKVKRLFMFFSAHHSWPWAEKLDRSAIDLGKGKRLIVRGGRYDREFRITVPKRFGMEY